MEDWKIECEYDYDVILELADHLKLAGIILYNNKGEIRSKDEVMNDLVPIIDNLPPKLIGAIISNLAGNLADFPREANNEA